MHADFNVIKSSRKSVIYSCSVCETSCLFVVMNAINRQVCFFLVLFSFLLALSLGQDPNLNTNSSGNKSDPVDRGDKGGEKSGFDGTVFGLAFGLAHIPLFAGIAVAVVIGIYCCYKKKKSGGREELMAIAEKGGLVILDDELLRAKEEGRLTVNVSILDNGQPSKPNDYSKRKYEGDFVSVNVSPDKSSHIKNEALPQVPSEERVTKDGRSEDHCNKSPNKDNSNNSDGYSLMGSESPNKQKLVDNSSDGYTLLGNEQSEGEPANDTGYEEVNEQDVMTSGHYEVSEEFLKSKVTEDEHDYEEPYWEPANKEEELMEQLGKLNVPVIPEKDIEMKEILGSGQFGTVYSATWTRTGSDSEGLTEVAVKSMKEGASEEDRTKFLQEAAIMGQFKHAYILRILGYMTGDTLRIVVEVMHTGDLRQHLLTLRHDNSQAECKELGAILLSYTRQIALGMGYLSLKQYVHRDLAARNVLVSDEGICKIADFGLSRELQNEDYYVSRGGKIPVKWTAPEALQYRKYSTASDVWSYGCLLYEIWSLGYKPFHELNNAQAMLKVASGFRLPPPPGCPRSIYRLMIKCWHPNPSSRPGFCEIVVALQHPDFQILKWTQKDIDACDSENSRILGSPLEEGNGLFTDLQCTYKTTDTNDTMASNPRCEQS